MYNMRRKPTFKSQPSLISSALRENFKPDIEWTDDTYNRMLLVQLPGFKREEIRVQLDSAGKLFIRGSRLAAANKYLDVDESFDVPKDIITEKISGKFEDGRLTLIMPKRVITENEAIEREKTVSEERGKEYISDEAMKEKEARQEEEKLSEDKTGEEKKVDRTSDEKATTKETAQIEPTQMEKTPTTTEAMTEKKSKIAEAMQNEPTKNDKSTAMDTIQNELTQKEINEEMFKETTQKEKPKNNFDDNKDGNIQNSKPKSDEVPTHKEVKKTEQGIKEKLEAVEKIKEDFNESVKAVSSEVKKEKENKKETIKKMKSKIKEICTDKPKEIKKKIQLWREAEDSWFDYKYIDGALEKMNRNRNMIAVAVMAFSVGFYISHKLKSK